MKNLVFGLLLAALLGFPAATYSQVDNKILEQLEDALTFETVLITNGALAQISDLEIIHTKLSLSLFEDEFGSNIISIDRYFANANGRLFEVSDLGELVELTEFVKSFKEGFKLRSPEDGLLLQTAFNLITQDNRNEGFFNVGNKWYFIRSHFFRRYFVVETLDDGTITSVRQTEGIESRIPDEVYFEGEWKHFEDFEVPEITEALRNEVEKLFAKRIAYRFELEEGQSQFLTRISDANLYYAKLIIDENIDDYSSQSSYHLPVLEHNGKIDLTPEFWRTNLFVESTKSVFKLKRDADAQLFQDFLNEQEAKDEGVRFFHKEGLWMFVRDDFFGEETGFIVQTNNEGLISRVQKTFGFSDVDVLRFKMADPGYPVDFGFRLVDPNNHSFTFIKDEIDIAVGERNEWIEIEVLVEFNELAVNAKGAWILTRFDGENVGMLASTNMVSPFVGTIPVSNLNLERGTHEVDFLLLSPGSEDIDKPLGRVVVKLIVE